MCDAVTPQCRSAKLLVGRCCPVVCTSVRCPVICTQKNSMRTTSARCNAEETFWSASTNASKGATGKRTALKSSARNKSKFSANARCLQRTLSVGSLRNFIITIRTTIYPALKSAPKKTDSKESKRHLTICLNFLKRKIKSSQIESMKLRITITVVHLALA